MWIRGKDNSSTSDKDNGSTSDTETYKDRYDSGAAAGSVRCNLRHSQRKTTFEVEKRHARRCIKISYYNVTDEQVKKFMDLCPVCICTKEKSNDDANDDAVVNVKKRPIMKTEDDFCVDLDEFKDLIPVLKKNYGLEESPDFPLGAGDIGSILDLNRAERRYLVQDGSSISKGVHVLSRVSNDINSVFFASIGKSKTVRPKHRRDVE
jgi:hypothetical protein